MTEQTLDDVNQHSFSDQAGGERVAQSLPFTVCQSERVVVCKANQHRGHHSVESVGAKT